MKPRRRRNPFVIVLCLGIIAVVGLVAYFEQAAERQSIQMTQMRDRLRRLEASQETAGVRPEAPPPRADDVSADGRYRIVPGDAGGDGEIRELFLTDLLAGETRQLFRVKKGLSFVRGRLTDGPESSALISPIVWSADGTASVSAYDPDVDVGTCGMADETCVFRVPIREFRIRPQE